MADYTGLPTSRWTELERGDGWRTSIGAEGSAFGGWHHLLQAGYAEYDSAVANALAAAKRAVNANPEYGASQ